MKGAPDPRALVEDSSAHIDALVEIASRGTAHTEPLVVAELLSAGLIMRPLPSDTTFGFRPWTPSDDGVRLLSRWTATYGPRCVEPDANTSVHLPPSPVWSSLRGADPKVLPLSRRRDRDVPF